MKNTWRFKGNEIKYVAEVLESGEISGTSGNFNQRFEQLFAKKVGAKYAVTFNSGTGTLHAALDAVGVEAGDEVIIPPLTVISNVDVIFAQNAVPIFVDVDSDTFNIDPSLLRKKISSKTKAIMPVSLFGLSCDLEAINNIAKEFNIPVINDAAEAHMSEYQNQPIARFADITSYSLENSKHITTGDGGIVVTDNEEYARKMRKFGSLGYADLKSNDGRIRVLTKDIFQDPSYKRHDSFGYNYRMPEVAAAIGLAQTERMDLFVQLRIDIAKMYDEVVKNVDYLVPQKVPVGYKNTYWTYVVKYLRKDISWQDFRKKYIEFGGDGIYGSWAITYEETLMAKDTYKKRCPWIYNNLSYKKGLCPVAENIQPQLMQFVNNYESMEIAQPKINALRKTINYFK